MNAKEIQTEIDNLEKKNFGNIEVTRVTYILRMWLADKKQTEEKRKSMQKEINLGNSIIKTYLSEIEKQEKEIEMLKADKGRRDIAFLKETEIPRKRIAELKEQLSHSMSPEEARAIIKNCNECKNYKKSYLMRGLKCPACHFLIEFFKKKGVEL